MSIRLLIVANRTCPCPALTDAVADLTEGAEASVVIVAPALNSRLRHYVSDVDGAVTEARERLSQAVDALRGRGIDCRGEVGDSDPALAVEDVLAAFEADEIIISTHPPGQSNWLESGMVDRLREQHGLPVTHLVSEYGLAASAN